MKISEAAKAVGMPVKTLRYYADIGLVAPAGRSQAGYRIYDEDSLHKLEFVRRARAFGFSIPACRTLLQLYENPQRASADVQRLATDRLVEIKRKQSELAQLHDTLSRLVAECQGNHEPDCPIIKALA